MSIFGSQLIQDQISACCIVNKAIVDDGYGGYKTKWMDGATFDAVITVASGIESAIAGITKEKANYGVKVERNVPLEHHSVFKRLEDGQLFRITRQSAMLSPSFSALNMKCLDAEEFAFTEDDTEDEDESDG